MNCRRELVFRSEAIAHRDGNIALLRQPDAKAVIALARANTEAASVNAHNRWERAVPGLRAGHIQLEMPTIRIGEFNEGQKPTVAASVRYTQRVAPRGGGQEGVVSFPVSKHSTFSGLPDPHESTPQAEGLHKGRRRTVVYGIDNLSSFRERRALLGPRLDLFQTRRRRRLAATRSPNTPALRSASRLTVDLFSKQVPYFVSLTTILARARASPMMASCRAVQ
jgi:hypothetical protein